MLLNLKVNKSALPTYLNKKNYYLIRKVLKD
jgi:hypothetical protein